MTPKRWIVTAAAAGVGAAAVVVWIMAAGHPMLPPAVLLEQAASNPTGWEWLMPPREVDAAHPVRAVWLSDEAALTLVGTRSDDLYASVMRPAPAERAPLKTAFRVIEIKGDGRREKGRAVSAMWNGDGASVAVYRLNWDDDAPVRTTLLGLEVCRPDGKRALAREAAAEAATAGIEVPALPELDLSYSFEFTDVNGNAIHSSDLCGKVVIVNIWATWCGPCMAKLPLLKEAYEQYHALGLEIVAISLDRDVADPVRVYAEHGIEWPLVFIPADDRTRDLWRQATDTSGIPRMIVMDREGIVRDDFHGADLISRVGSYFEPATPDGWASASR
ncbi:MAG: TlpA disulfide reductase family protein [Planctomycetota bacterium]|jgi:thiol-disulfide isomerase/thioredoxin